MSTTTTKSDRKATVEAASIKGAFDETPFGRRRISKHPRKVLALLSLMAVPFVLIYRLVWSR